MMAVVGIALRIVSLLAAVMFLGDIIIGAFWKVSADRTKSAPVIRYAQGQVAWMDKWVLIPSIVVMVVTGIAGAQLAGIPLTSPIYLGAQLCFFLSGVVWRGVLRPVQAQQLELVAKIGPEGAVPEPYFVLADKWLRFGLVAIALPVIALVLMVLL